MSRSFNLTAELNLRGPNNIGPIINNIRRQLTGINVNVGVRVDPRANRDIINLQQSITRLNATLTQTQTAAAAASNAISTLARNTTNFSTSVNNLPRNIGNVNSAVNNVGSAMNRANNNVNQATQGFEAFGRQSALAVRRFAAFATVTGIIFKFTNAISSATSEFIGFNKELVRVAQVTDSSLSQLAPLVRTITTLSTSMGIASKDLIQVSSTLAQAGLSAKETEKALKALALSALAPSFDSLNDTVEGSIALMRQFGVKAGDLEAALGSINAVSAKFAVESGDIITAIQRTGGVFAAASKGVSEGKDALNEFIAVFTSVRATTRESAETIATGLRTIFTRIQRGGTIDALKDYGVVLTDLSGKFVGPYEAVKRLSEGLSKLDPRDLKFSQIVEELGGFRQIGKVIPLIQQFATAQQALKVAQEGQSSLSKDAATAQLSVANRLTKVREEFNALIRSLGESSTFQTFVKLSLDLASALIRLADSAKTVLPALTAIAAFKGAAAITRFGSGFFGGMRRQNSGGYVRGFASGGYVPGEGDGDTVPAMLSPGEFVIRKKAVKAIGVGNLHKMNRYASGGHVQKLAGGGFPLVDDLPNAPGSMLPVPGVKPGSPLDTIIKNGGGALDYDRTLQRTLGDKAYSSAKTEAQKEAVLTKYFRDSSARLQDAKTARLTQFGKQLQELIKKGVISPKNLSIISKSKRVPGIADHIHELFGIPVQNMVFTEGGSKTPALEAMRSKGPRINRVSKNLGGLIQRFAGGGAADTLEKFYKGESLVGGAALSPENKKKMTLEQRKIAASQLKDLRSLRSSAPTQLFSAISRTAFDSMAQQAGFNKDPKNVATLVGKTFKSSNLLSTSKNFAKAKSFLDNAERGEDNWGAMLDISTKKNAKGVDVVQGLAGRKIDKTKQEIDPRTGKMKTYSMKPPESEEEFTLFPGSKFRIEAAKFNELFGHKNLRMKVQQFAQKTQKYNSGKVEPLNPADQAELQGLLSLEKRSNDSGGKLRAFTKDKQNRLSQLKSRQDIAGEQTEEQIRAKKERAQQRLVAKGEKFALVGLFGGKGIAGRKSNNKPAKPLSISYGSLDKVEDGRWGGSLGSEYESIMKGRFRDTIKFIGKDMSGRIGASPVSNEDQIDKIMKKAGIESAIGAMLEGAIGIAGAPYSEGIGKQNDPIDFPNGLGPGLAGLFGLPSEFANVPTDATRNVSSKGKGISGFIGQISRYIDKQNSGNLEQTIGNSVPTGAENAVSAKKRGRKTYAIGGSVEDTVPALLTPGEFVINKHAASRLGAAKLNQLNRADKLQGFNKGGAVGGVVKLASGGLIDQSLGQMGERDSARLRASIQRDAAAFDRLERLVAGWPLEDVGKAVKTFARALEKGARESDAATKAINTTRGSGGATRTPKKGVLQQSAGVSESRAVVNPSVPQGFAASQARLDQISADTTQYSQRNMARSFAQQNQPTFAQRYFPTLSGAGPAPSLPRVNGIVGYNMPGGGGGGAPPANNPPSGGGGGGNGGTTGAASGGGGRRGILGRFGGRRGRGGGGMGGMAAFAVPMLAGPIIDQISKAQGGESTEAGRRTSAIGSSVINYGSSGAMIGSMFGPWGTAIGAASGALVGFVAGLDDADKATQEYVTAQAKAKTDTLMETSSQAIDKFAADPTKVNRENLYTQYSKATASEAVLGDSIKQQKVGRLGSITNAALKYTGIGTAANIVGGLTGMDLDFTSKNESLNSVSKRKAESQKAGADQAEKILAAEMMNAGKTFSQLSTSMEPGKFKTLTQNIAEADTGYQMKREMLTQRVAELTAANNPAAAKRVQEEGNKELEALANTIAQRVTLEESNAAKAKAEAAAKQALIDASIKAAMSIEKSFEIMEQSFNKFGNEIDNLTAKSAQIMSGKASLTSSSNQNAINVLQNPDAYSEKERKQAIAQASSNLGPQGTLAEKVAEFGPAARNAALKTASALQSKPAPGGDVKKINEDVGAAVERDLINQILTTFGPDSPMSKTLIEGVRTSTAKMVEEAGSNPIDAEKLVDAAAGPLIKASESAGKQLINSLQATQKAFSALGEQAQNIADLQQKQVDRTNAARERAAQNNLTLRATRGEDLSSNDKISSRMTTTAQRLGFNRAEDVTAGNIAQKRSAAVIEQQRLQGEIAAREKAGPQTEDQTRELFKFKQELAAVNQTIESTDKELAGLGDTLQNNFDDIVAEIQKKVSEIESRKEAKANFAEKLVTSTPEEMRELSETYARLQGALSGNIVTIERSRTAQTAYATALQSGKTRQEAMGEAQSAFANENKKVFSLFNDMMQMSGVKGDQFDKMRADLLENMAKSQGMGLQNSPMFKSVIKELRTNAKDRTNPEVEALMQKADIIKNAQAQAVAEQNKIDRDAQKELLQGVVKELITQLANIKIEVNNNVAKGAAAVGQAAPRLSKGGVIYASNGRLINFQPKGTDTVPAMLTPGEFVVNRQAAQKNMGTLQAINSGDYYDDGGPVRGRVVQGVRLPDQPDQRISSILNNTNSANSTLSYHTKSLKGIDKTTSNILKDIRESKTFSSGGVVYASKGTLVNYQPKGTDTVPAMLTPGEFVVNRQAAQKNMGTLQAINSGYYAGGGPVLNKKQLMGAWKDNQLVRVTDGLTPDTWAVGFKQVPYSGRDTIGFVDDQGKWVGDTKKNVNSAFGVSQTGWKDAVNTRAPSAKEAYKNIKNIMAKFDSKTMKLFSGSQIYGSYSKKIKNKNPADLVIDELMQQAEATDISEFNVRKLKVGGKEFNVGIDVDEKIKEIIQKIDNGEDPEYLYSRATARENFLKYILDNIAGAQSILKSTEPKFYNKKAVDTANSWFIKQTDDAKLEKDIIPKVWNKVKKQKNLLGLQPSNQKIFTFDNSPKASWFDKGGKVDPAMDIIKRSGQIERRSDIRNSDLEKRLRKIASTKLAKQNGIRPEISSIVDYLSRVNPKELKSLSNLYPQIQDEIKNRQLLEKGKSGRISPFGAGGVVYAQDGVLVGDEEKKKINPKLQAILSRIAKSPFGRKHNARPTPESIARILAKHNPAELDSLARRYDEMMIENSRLGLAAQRREFDLRMNGPFGKPRTNIETDPTLDIVLDEKRQRAIALQNEVRKIAISSLARKNNVQPNIESVLKFLYNRKMDLKSYPEIKKEIERRKQEADSKPVRISPFNSGGIVYAAKGGLYPNNEIFRRNREPDPEPLGNNIATYVNDQKLDKLRDKKIEPFLSKILKNKNLGKLLSKWFPGIGTINSILTGISESKEDNKNIFESLILSMLTGDTRKGGAVGDLFGLDPKSTANDLTGILGSITSGALLGGGMGGFPGAIGGAFLGGVAELYKIYKNYEINKENKTGTMSVNKLENNSLSKKSKSYISFIAMESERLKQKKQNVSKLRVYDQNYRFRGYDVNKDRIIDDSGEQFLYADRIRIGLARYSDNLINRINNQKPINDKKKLVETKTIDQMMTMPSNRDTVYASNGMLIPYRPRGTDTVPAMLTPGEFVVNRNATQKHLPLLQSINRSSGGSVSYLANGTPGASEFQDNVKYLSEILKFGADTLSKAFDEAVKNLNKMAQPTTTFSGSGGVSNNNDMSKQTIFLENFGNKLDNFVDKLYNWKPPAITLDHQVNVVVNGASILQNVLSGPIGNMVEQAIQRAFDKKSRENEGH